MLDLPASTSPLCTSAASLSPAVSSHCITCCAQALTTFGHFGDSISCFLTQAAQEDFLVTYISTAWENRGVYTLGPPTLDQCGAEAILPGFCRGLLRSVLEQPLGGQREKCSSIIFCRSFKLFFSELEVSAGSLVHEVSGVFSLPSY